MGTNVKSALVFVLAISCMVVFTIILVAQKKTKGGKHTPDAYATSANFQDHLKNKRNKEDSLVAFAKSLIGTPYVYASSSPSGFDCSGFVYYVYKKFNMDVSRSSYTIGEQGKEIDTVQAMKGDIILFQGTDMNDPKIGHVGIIISEKGQPIEFIHSSSSTKNNGVVITKLTDGHYRQRFIKVVRVF